MENRYTRIETPRHTFVFDSQLQELIVTLPGWPPLRFFDLSECYALVDVLSELPDRQAKQRQEDTRL